MITKKELVELLKSLDIPVNEGLTSKVNTNKFPRVVFWDYVWDEIHASDDSYDTVVTYQVSFHSLRPRDKKLLELRRKLHEKGIRPMISHEVIQDTLEVHSFFSIEVLEDLDDE